LKYQLVTGYKYGNPSIFSLCVRFFWVALCLLRYRKKRTRTIVKTAIRVTIEKVNLFPSANAIELAITNVNEINFLILFLFFNFYE